MTKETIKNFEIREVTVSDADGIQIISQADLGYECTVSFVEGKIQSLDKNREQVFVACKDEVVLGYIHVEKYDTLYFETMCNVLGLAVRKDSQKMGIGKALLLAGETWAKQNEIKYMRVNSGITRVEAHKFYTHMGYESEKKQLRFIKQI